MTVKSRRPMGGLPGTQRPAGDQATAKNPVGRPQGHTHEAKKVTA